MNTSTRRQIDSFLDAFLHETLSQQDAEELCRLASEDHEVVKQIRRTLSVEAALRSKGVVPNVASTVVSHLRQRDQRQEAQVLHAVMSQVRSRPAPVAVMAAKRRRLTLLSVGVATVAASAAMAAIFVWPGSHSSRRMGRHEGVAQQQDTAVVQQRGKGRADLDERSHPARFVKGADQSSAVAQEQNVFEYDFEDGVLPAFFEQGHVIAASSGGSSRYVVQGTLNPWAPNVSSIFINRPGGLFRFHNGLVLRFRYFVAADAKSLRVQTFDIDQQQNYQWNLPNPVRGAWATGEAPIATFYPVKDQSRRLEPGDRLQNVFVMGGSILGPPLLLDDLVLGPATSP